jgi:hypothetical protein
MNISEFPIDYFTIQKTESGYSVTNYSDLLVEKMGLKKEVEQSFESIRENTPVFYEVERFLGGGKKIRDNSFHLALEMLNKGAKIKAF